MLSASASNLKMELSPIFLFLDIFEILGTVLFIGTFWKTTSLKILTSYYRCLLRQHGRCYNTNTGSSFSTLLSLAFVFLLRLHKLG